MNIETNITCSDIELERFITNNNGMAYNFISATICVEFDFDGVIEEATYQTGHSYHYGDYSLPSNCLSLYEGSNLIELLDNYNEDDLFNHETINDINSQLDTSFSKDELTALYVATLEATQEAQALVDEKEQEADDEMNNDNNAYVIFIEMEEECGEKRQCSEAYPKQFSEKEEAEEFVIDSLKKGHKAYITDKETAYSMKHEFLSNF